MKIENNINLFLFVYGNNGDIVTVRPLISLILDRFSNIKIKFAIYDNQSYLLEDLPVEIIKVGKNFNNSGLSDHPRYESFCPSDYIPLNLWLGQYSDTTKHDWFNQVKVFNRKCQEKNLPLFLDSNLVPMISFPYFKVNVKADSVYLDNCSSLSGHSQFIFNIEMLSKNFQHLNFYTTSAFNGTFNNVTDCSHLNLVQLSSLSNKCDLIIGKGSGPFLTTYTDCNRFKPRAVVGFDLNRFQSFWDYPRNPLIYIHTMDDVINFIKNQF